jgi:hypothetical protein
MNEALTATRIDITDQQTVTNKMETAWDEYKTLMDKLAPVWDTGSITKQETIMDSKKYPSFELARDMYQYLNQYFLGSRWQ